MVPDKYKRMLISAISTFIISGIGLVIWAYFSNDTLSIIMTAAFVLLIHILLIGYSTSCYVTTKKNNPGKVELDYECLERFIIKPDTWFIKRLMIFDDQGKFFGKTRLKIDGLKSFLLSNLSHYTIILPMDYEVRNHEDNLIVKFKRSGFKSAIVHIFDDKNNHIGKVEFDELKVLLKFRGQVYTGKDKYPVSTDVLFGDLQNDIMTLDSLSNSIEYHKIFREMSTEVATLSEPISTDTGKVALALLNILYLLRSSNS